MRILPHQIISTALLIAVTGGYLTLAVWFPTGYIWATYEDLFGEWSQTFAFAVAAYLFLLSATLGTRHRWALALLGLSCCYVFLEEISWGQRLFGFSSPDFFRENNLQGETNIHNFFTGPYATMLKQALRYCVAAGLIAYGLILPLLRRYGSRLAAMADAWHIPIAPLFLAPYFVLAAALELRPFGFNEAEIAELLVGLALAGTALHYYLANSPAMTGPGPDARALSSRFAQRFAIALAVVACLAAATTTAMYASPDRRAEIDQRISNGMEKFAARYARLEYWRPTALLYEALLAENSDNSYLMRQTARSYHNLGAIDRFDHYAQLAIESDLRKLEAEPWRESLVRSLVRDFRLSGDTALEQAYLDMAVDMGLKRVEDHPESANAAFSLGRSYALAGRTQEAEGQFRRAVELNPSSSRFREAWEQVRQ